MKRYEYQVIDNTDLQTLNDWGSKGWLVVDRHFGKALIVKEIEE